MGDDKRLEQQFYSLSTGQEQMLKQIQEMLHRMQVRDEASSNRQRIVHRNPGYEGASESVFPKLAKLDFPKYDGSKDPTTWICQAEQFFEFQDTPPKDQVLLAVYHLEGDAQLWFYWHWHRQLHCDITSRVARWVVGKVWKFSLWIFFFNFLQIFANSNRLGQSETTKINLTDYWPKWERLLLNRRLVVYQ